MTTEAEIMLDKASRLYDELDAYTRMMNELEVPAGTAEHRRTLLKERYAEARLAERTLETFQEWLDKSGYTVVEDAMHRISGEIKGWGLCPHCGGKCVQKRWATKNDVCENGHVYPHYHSVRPEQIKKIEDEYGVRFLDQLNPHREPLSTDPPDLTSQFDSMFNQVGPMYTLPRADYTQLVEDRDAYRSRWLEAQGKISSLRDNLRETEEHLQTVERAKEAEIDEIRRTNAELLRTNEELLNRRTEYLERIERLREKLNKSGITVLELGQENAQLRSQLDHANSIRSQS